MDRRQRFQLKRVIVSRLDDNEAWPWQERSLLFTEFGLEPPDSYNNEVTLADVIGSIGEDQDLIEIYSLVTGTEPESIAAEQAQEHDAYGNWLPGYIRLFLSHSARHKASVGEIAQELRPYGIHGFVAHDNIKVTVAWQEQIERALWSMDVFAAIVHPEFNESAFCHDEVGWAIGRGVPHLAVRMGADPNGFLGSTQWPSGHDRTAKEVAATIGQWIWELPDISTNVFEGLLRALASAGNYVDAGATASRIASLPSLSDENLEAIEDVWWSNDQLFGGHLPNEAIRPLFVRHGRPWPPPRRTT